jgi:hypothetical protein
MKDACRNICLNAECQSINILCAAEGAAHRKMVLLENHTVDLSLHISVFCHCHAASGPSLRLNCHVQVLTL